MGLGAVALVAAGLRIYALDYQSLWTDEIFSLMATDPALPFRQFWDRLLADTVCPRDALLRAAVAAVDGRHFVLHPLPALRAA
jgi:hypothetical protein